MPRRKYDFDASFDFDYRPESYWPEAPTKETVLARVKGTVRRDVARRHLREAEDTAPQQVEEFFLKEDLGETEKAHFGSLHPFNLGGEYLPDLLDDEIEIARLELRSVTGDVIQVRARPTDDGISYRVVDEYWDEGVHYLTATATSPEPLRLGELIDLMDDALAIRGDEEDPYGPGLVEPNLDCNLEAGVDLEVLAGFVKVSSAFYPRLQPYFEARSGAWYQERLDDEDE